MHYHYYHYRCIAISLYVRREGWSTFKTWPTIVYNIATTTYIHSIKWVQWTLLELKEQQESNIGWIENKKKGRGQWEVLLISITLEEQIFRF